jgi:hypothetical protein
MSLDSYGRNLATVVVFPPPPVPLRRPVRADPYTLAQAAHDSRVESCIRPWTRVFRTVCMEHLQDEAHVPRELDTPDLILVLYGDAF